jgi:molecular chaperone GrpE
MKEDLENSEESPTEENPVDRPGAGAGSHDHSRGDGEGEDGSAELVRHLTAERDELRDLLLRKQAEFDNFRKRTERERSEFAQFASADLMRELLNVLDSFELALRNSESDPDGERKGFLLIHKQLLDTLSRSGLESIDAMGQRFDPNVHEAVTTQPAPEGVDDGTVLADLRTGYLLKGKLLRPSIVVVAKSDPGGD